MGAWGTGAFSNDDAADFIGELGDGDDAELTARIRDALTLPDVEYVELPEASAAVAAAAVLAMKRGFRPPDGSELDLDDVVRRVPPPDEELLRQASSEMRRVREDDSEWKELWDDASALDEALAVVSDIEQHLVP